MSLFHGPRRETVWNLLAAFAVWAVNLRIVARLFRTPYLPAFTSIEGAFVAYSRYIMQHGGGSHDWFSMWRSGMPQSLVYQPGLFHVVALVANTFRWDPGLAYHAVTAFTYSLGGVAIFLLAQQLSTSRIAAFLIALVYSVWSPSTLIGSIRRDAGGVFHLRRLQALVGYGEGPNVTGLALSLVALALFHRAAKTRSILSIVLAAIALASVLVTSWPSSVALAVGIAAYLFAGTLREIRANVPIALIVSIVGYAFAIPWALPSTIAFTFLRTHAMSDGPTWGIRYACVALSLAGAALLLRWWFLRARYDLAIRFAAQYALALSGVVIPALWGLRLVPQALRFHLAAEAPILLLLGLVLTRCLAGRPLAARAVCAAVAAFCFACFWINVYDARRLIKRTPIRESVEYREAKLFERLGDQKVYAPGSTKFWMNAFTDSPQAIGCCDQSDLNPLNPTLDFTVTAGVPDTRRARELALLWLKAFAVDAIGVSGPHARESFREFRDPRKFDGLPVLWRSGDDVIYQIPERARGLARVVRTGDLVRHTPVSGDDTAELQKFVADLDDPSLPIATTTWVDRNRLSIAATLAPGQGISVAENYHPGWHALSGGRPVLVHKDALGFIVLEPQATGPQRIELNWTPGLEPYLAVAICVLAWLLAAVAMIRGARVPSDWFGYRPSNLV